jgi:hypothetical protein
MGRAGPLHRETDLTPLSGRIFRMQCLLGSFRNYQGTSSMATTTIPLTEVAKSIPADLSVVRRALNRFGLVEHQSDG